MLWVSSWERWTDELGVVMIAVAASLLVDKIGRRKLFLASTAGMVRPSPPRRGHYANVRTCSSSGSGCLRPVLAYSKIQAGRAPDTASWRPYLFSKLPMLWLTLLVRIHLM